MLPKKYRVKKIKEFEDLFSKNSLYFGAREFYIKYINNQEKFSKVSVVVPKKIEKRAVYRNRIKRRVSEILRLMYKKIKPGFNIILICKEEINNIQDYKELEKKIEDLFIKAQLINS